MVEDLIKKDSKKRISFELIKHKTYKAEMQSTKLHLANEHAKDPLRVDRTRLLAIYKEVLRAPHLLSQIRNNILKVIGSLWPLFKEGSEEIGEEATRLLQKQWFQKYQDEYHLTKYFGHSIIEFQPMVLFRIKGLKLELKNVQVIL